MDMNHSLSSLSPTIHQSVSYLGVSPDHMLGLYASIIFPFIIIVFMITIRLLSPSNSSALKLKTTWFRLPLFARVASIGLLYSSFIHLVLIPAHFAEPLTALLFFLDALLMAFCVHLIKANKAYKPLAVFLLLGSLVAYFYYINTGLEDSDTLGTFTKITEILTLMAIGTDSLIEYATWPQKPRRRNLYRHGRMQSKSNYS